MKLCIAIPSYDLTIPVETAVHLSQATATLQRNGIPVTMQWGTASLIDLNRSRLIKRFLYETECDKLFFLDADIIFKTEDFLRLVMHSQKYDAVGAIYPRRADPPKFFMKVKPDRELTVNEDGLMEIIGMGMGFCIIDRKVFDKMRPLVPVVQTADDAQLEFFCDIRYSPTHCGEDISFFKRWCEDCGGKVFIDPAINLKHVGRKEFEYDFFQYLDEKCIRDSNG